jgi:predicted RNase H-like HicB family nuclease
MDALMRRFRLEGRIAAMARRRRVSTTGRGREKAGGGLACGLLVRSADGYPGSMPEMPRTLTAALHREEDWYIAQCLEVDVASQGHTIDEALASLAEAVELYLEEVDDPAGHITATPLVTSFRLPAA